MKLEVKNIFKSFGDKEVLHGVSFNVSSGKALGLLGRNGAGKTTTIRIIMDVFHSNSGEILLDGVKFNPSEHLIGYLPEERGLYPKKTVTEQLVYLARIRGLSKAKAKENTAKWLKKLEVDQYANVKLETLSKGNQQKVQLASTLVSDPEIVILDEPFSGLDPVNSRILQNVVEEIISEGRVVIFSSHQMSYVEEFCEEIAIINKGNVVLSGNLNEIKKDFGKNQMVIKDVVLDNDKVISIINSKLSGCLEITGNNKDGVIVRDIKGLSRNDIVGKIMDAGITIEKFETYYPSLNDIFVAKVGDENVDENIDENANGNDKENVDGGDK